MLTLYEELAALAIHEGKGSFIKTTIERLKPGLAGAILAELWMVGKLQTTHNHRVQLVDNTPTEDRILDEAMRAIHEAGKERKCGYWISALSHKGDKTRQHIVESLVNKGVLAEDDEHLAWVAPSPLQPEAAASSAKYWLIHRLRAVVLAQEEAAPRDIVLLNLLRACGMLDLVFLRDERRLADQYIYELGVNHALKDPLIQTVQEIASAVAAAVEED